jgi:hypothetical protein
VAFFGCAAAPQRQANCLQLCVETSCTQAVKLTPFPDDAHLKLVGIENDSFFSNITAARAGGAMARSVHLIACY